ncbi:hypothetical protein [Polaromonas jejuensis]|uniref:Uncharacterized protein n=1 Tax=Polaromonas jejuensis TaxID=457502 RepID=A0ABW0Q888_9BURK|nr:hypothetical protein [Polaromonas jejuensis]
MINWYVRMQPGDIDGAGTLLAGREINLNLSGDLTQQRHHRRQNRGQPDRREYTV